MDSHTKLFLWVYIFEGLHVPAILTFLSEDGVESSLHRDSVIRGYHVYKEIWEASCGQVFPCLREVGNAFDPFAVSVVRDGDIIGHVPRKISATCSLFLRNRGTVKCTVTEKKRKEICGFRGWKVTTKSTKI